jgi:uncharacterized membrane protein
MERGVTWIILVIAVVAVILIARGYLGPSKKEGGSSGESTLGVLNKRYGRGDINKEEFEEKKQGLMH